MAFSALVTVMLTGNVRTNSASYRMTSGWTLGVVIVVFRPPSVWPRIPVASDLPPIDTVIVEVPNPGHPYGVRGVGETSIVPPLAALGIAVTNATGVRQTHVPMSPPRVLKSIKSKAK